ncbi:MAG: polymer-forming cytoskeletal family protein [Burkholderiales bacterium]|nr:polymer-forming cytoskeletal family protein [Burkholderiales bacterium]
MSVFPARGCFATVRRLAWASAAALVFAAPAASDDGQAANVYATGADVKIDAPVEGDLYAAAGRVSVGQPVRGDAVVAAGSIDLSSTVGDDLRAAGGVVTLAARIDGEALIAGGSIAFGRDAEVLGRVWLAGGDIAVAGKLRSGIRIYGKNIVILGEIHGPVALYGEQIEIVGSARIVGEVRYSSPNEIRIDPKAQISGGVTRTAAAFEFPRPHLPGLPAVRPLLLLGLLAAGALLLSLFPRFTAHALKTLGAFPIKSIGLGTAIFFSLPPVILLLTITIIGIPIALMLAGIYGAALLIGYLVTAFFVGDRLLHGLRPHREATFVWRVASLAAALLLLWLAYAIPYVGALTVLIALFAGLGAMVLQAFSSYSGTA